MAVQAMRGAIPPAFVNAAQCSLCEMRDVRQYGTAENCSGICAGDHVPYRADVEYAGAALRAVPA
jgi:hypothetical protein